MPAIPLLERAAAHGDAVALRCGTREHTYDELLARARGVAAVLLDGSDDLRESRIAFLVPAGPDFVATLWGIWLAGGIAVPLSLAATGPELEHVLGDVEASCVVATAATTAGVAAVCTGRSVRLVVLDGRREESRATAPAVDPGRRALILFTSGTTSRPKGVVTTHACTQAQIESLIEAWRWRADDRIPLFLPLHHIHGIINILSCCLWAGGSVDVHGRFECGGILGRVAADAYTVFMAVPTIYVKLIEAIEALPVLEREPVLAAFGRMRLMVSGSAALPASVFGRWHELTGQRLLERYGMTEIGMALSNPFEGDRRPGTVGRPLPGVEVRLRTDGGRPAADGEQGEIQVRGPTVFREYWNRPEATREAFQEGWFRTGDVAVVEDGYHRILGRSSLDIIKSGGYKLSALEIEAALLDHPSVAECAVVGLPDETWGEAVAAAVVTRAAAPLDLEDLRSWCRDRISHYRIPRRLLVVSELPRNAMGKVTKPAVLALFQTTRG